MTALVLVCMLPRAAAAELMLETGHVDAFAVYPEGDSIALSLQEDVTGTHARHAPEDVELVVGEHAYTEETADLEGVEAPGYLLPQTQQSDLLWPGWDTQALAGAKDIDIEFLEVDGPGAVYLFQAQGLGGVGPVLESGAFEMTAGEKIHQDMPAHAHANWLFTQPGTYTMRVVAHADGATSNEATYTWRIGEGGERSESGEGSAGTESEKESEAADTAPLAETEAPVHRTEVHAGEQTQEDTAACKPGLRPQVKDDRQVPATWNDPADMVFGLGDAAQTELPEPVGPIPAGKAWMIGATQQAGVPWLGANTQHESLLEHTTGDVTWEVTSFDGPGSMFVFTQGGLGAIVGEEWFRAENGSAQGSHTIPANSHVHPNWVFSAPGTYHVGIRHSATAKDGGGLSGTATLTFEVGSAGNADDGHFDFGSVYDAEGDCGEAHAAGSAGTIGSTGSAGTGETAGATATRNGALAETGTTVMTLPIAVLGLGILVFGGGMLCLDTALRRRIFAALGVEQ